MTDRLKALISVNRAIVKSLDYDQVLDLVVEQAAALTAANLCLLVLADAEDTARIAAFRGLDPERASSFSAPFDERLGQTLRGLCAANDHDLFVAQPVMDHDCIRGMLVVLQRGAGELTSEDAFAISALADQAVIALEHASRYRQVKKQNELRSRLLAALQSDRTIHVAYLDPELRFLEANCAYCNMVKRPRSELVGYRYRELFPHSLRLDVLEEVVRTGEERALVETPSSDFGEAEDKDQESYWDWSARPVKADDGTLEAIVISALDVTHKVKSRHFLEEASARKDEFLAMLAHELRNPLAAIASASELLRFGAANESVLNRVRDVTTRQVQHMSHLLDDLLDVSRITTGRIELRRETIDLVTTIKDAVEALEDMVQAAGHELRLELPRGRMFVNGDADRLIQVVSNLLNNSIKYTPPGGHITVSLSRQRDQAEISISDDGVGISKAVLADIFELFVQDQRSLERAQGGLGIGLSLVKRIVSKHGGTVTAHSQGPGRGSTFRVLLPIVDVARLEKRQNGPTHHRQGLQILVVEDNVDAQQMLTDLLQFEGHQVTTAGDGERALELTLNKEPEVVLLDIGLPTMDGYEVAKRIRQLSNIHQPLVVAVTGYGATQDRERSRQSRIDYHCVKPLTFDALRSILATVRPRSAQSTC